MKTRFCNQSCLKLTEYITRDILNMTTAGVTYNIDFQSVSQGLSVAEFIIVSIVTIINLVIVWMHYARSYTQFCAQYVVKENKTGMGIEQELAMSKKKETNKEEDEEEQKDIESAKVDVVIDKTGKFFKDSSTLTILTCFSLTCYFLAALYALIIQAGTKEITFCVNFIIPCVWTYTIARGLQFTVYLARLDFLYSGTQCEYKKSTIMILATLTAIIAIVIMSLQAAFVDEVTLVINNESFPYFCQFLLKDFVLSYVIYIDHANIFTRIR